jgi:hypothetical protein
MITITDPTCNTISSVVATDIKRATLEILINSLYESRKTISDEETRIIETQKKILELLGEKNSVETKLYCLTKVNKRKCTLAIATAKMLDAIKVITKESIDMKKIDAMIELGQLKAEEVYVSAPYLTVNLKKEVTQNDNKL